MGTTAYVFALLHRCSSWTRQDKGLVLFTSVTSLPGIQRLVCSAVAQGWTL